MDSELPPHHGPRGSVAYEEGVIQKPQANQRVCESSPCVATSAGTSGSSTPQRDQTGVKANDEGMDE